jgi:hypothetical protein
MARGKLPFAMRVKSVFHLPRWIYVGTAPEYELIRCAYCGKERKSYNQA